MRRFRFNTKVGRSAGRGAFRTIGNDYHNLAPTYRTYADSGRYDMIEATVDYCTLTCSSGGYMPSADFWNELKQRPNRWDKDYWLHESVEHFTCNSQVSAKRVFEHVVHIDGMEMFEFRYTPIWWEKNDYQVTREMSEYVNGLTERNEDAPKMHLYDVAVRKLKDGRQVLYARNEWLRRFGAGRSLMVYYKMAKQRSFTKVYGF